MQAQGRVAVVFVFVDKDKKGGVLFGRAHFRAQLRSSDQFPTNATCSLTAPTSGRRSRPSLTGCQPKPGAVRAGGYHWHG